MAILINEIMMYTYFMLGTPCGQSEVKDMKLKGVF